MKKPVDLVAGAAKSSLHAKNYRIHDSGVFGFFISLRIGAKIILGFCFVLLILIAIVWLSNINTVSFRSAFDRQMTQGEEAQKIFEIDRKISDLQKYVLIYSHTGQVGALRRAESVNNEVLISLTRIFDIYQAIEPAPLVYSKKDIYSDKVFIISRMIEIVEKYPAKLKDLSAERVRSVDLLNNELARSVEEIEAGIDRIRSWEKSNHSDEVLSRIRSFDRGFVKQEREILEFFYNREFVLLDQIKLSFFMLKSTLEDVNKKSSDFDSSAAKVFDDIVEDYAHYEDVFYKTMQANRGYLYLVNVVLAGETAEFLLLSSRLRLLTLDYLTYTAEESRKRIEKTQKIANIASVAAIGFGLLLAFVIGTSIARPIRHIAQVVERLATGESDKQIPGLNRGDEIGQIARAADVFKEMNIQTEALLAETKRLAEDIRSREMMLEKKTQELEKTNEDLDNFAYVASHDLKSPLRGIDNLACWIEEDCVDVLPEVSAGHLKTLRSRISRMENLLTDLLHYSRADRLSQAVEEVDLNAMLLSTFEFIDRPEGSSLRLVTELPTLATQQAPLRQVFQNLFTNAVKYSDKAKPTIEVSVKDYDKDFYEFSVVDDGPGIDSRYHEKIFKMFQTLQARDIIEGSGMGLAIIKRVIENFGGVISVHSSPGEGAEFRFTWPKYMASQESE